MGAERKGIEIELWGKVVWRVQTGRELAEMRVAMRGRRKRRSVRDGCLPQRWEWENMRKAESLHETVAMSAATETTRQRCTVLQPNLLEFGPEVSHVLY